MTLVERLLELRLHLAHLRKLRDGIGDARQLEEDISLRNDVLHSLQTVCQIVIDVAGELSARHGLLTPRGLGRRDITSVHLSTRSGEPQSQLLG